MPFEDDQGRCEEFGSLGRSFNAMLSQLKDLRERNEIQSFALGRSESAVAVLHNVRNALAPLATILSHGIGRGDMARASWSIAHWPNWRGATFLRNDAQSWSRSWRRFRGGGHRPR